MRTFLLAIAMIASCASTHAQADATSPVGKPSQTAKIPSQATKQRSIGGENSSHGNSSSNASSHPLNHTASSAAAAAPARHPVAPQKTSAVRHHTPNAAVVGGPVNTNKSGVGALNGTTMKRKP